MEYWKLLDARVALLAVTGIVISFAVSCPQPIDTQSSEAQVGSSTSPSEAIPPADQPQAASQPVPVEPEKKEPAAVAPPAVPEVKEEETPKQPDPPKSVAKPFYFGETEKKLLDKDIKAALAGSGLDQVYLGIRTNEPTIVAIMVGFAYLPDTDTAERLAVMIRNLYHVRFPQSDFVAVHIFDMGLEKEVAVSRG